MPAAAGSTADPRFMAVRRRAGDHRGARVCRDLTKGSSLTLPAGFAGRAGGGTTCTRAARGGLPPETGRDAPVTNEGLWAGLRGAGGSTPARWPLLSPTSANRTVLLGAFFLAAVPAPQLERGQTQLLSSSSWEMAELGRAAFPFPP